MYLGAPGGVVISVIDCGPKGHRFESTLVCPALSEIILKRTFY